VSFSCPFISLAHLNLSSHRIGHLYNTVIGQGRKDMIEEWARDLYPEIWAELEKLGQQEMLEGYRMFKLPGVEIWDEAAEEEAKYEADM
jgi:hypothetical protein